MDELLKKATHEDLNYNKEILLEIKNLINQRKFIVYTHDDEFSKYLFSINIDMNWYYAQCQSLVNQINKIIDNNSKFNEYYNHILIEDDYLNLTKELIFDFSYLNQIITNQIEWNHRISRSNYMDEHQFFIHSKFSYFTNKWHLDESRINLTFSSMPMFIRQSIELKIKSMIGLERVLKPSGDTKIIPISKLINALEEGNFIDSPVSLEVLAHINFWTNTFIHTGIHPFSWQSLEAIDLVEPIFTIKQGEIGALNLRGFRFLRRDISLEEVKEKLDNKFHADFILNENIMSQRYYI